jgi:hypothetical protein
MKEIDKTTLIQKEIFDDDMCLEFPLLNDLFTKILKNQIRRFVKN